MRGLRALALGLALLLDVATASATPPTLRQLSPGIYVHVAPIAVWGTTHGGDVGNMGVVIGERCVAVIDTGGSAAVGSALREALQRLTDRPVCWVINTHVHPDHFLGNQAFDAPGTHFVGHRHLPVALAARAPYYLNQLRRDFGAAIADDTRLIVPSELVDTRLELDLGGRRLLVQAWPTSHTDTDLTVLDETSGTIFLGDLLFREHLPVLDGRLQGWLATLDTLAQMPVSQAVPGHGEPTRDWPGALAPQRDYLESLRTEVRRALHAGWTLLETIDRLPAAPPQWRLSDDFHVRNLTAAYAELEWED